MHPVFFLDWIHIFYSMFRVAINTFLFIHYLPALMIKNNVWDGKSECLIFIDLGLFDFMIRCVHSTCRAKILRGATCPKCNLDNSREVGRIALEILEERGVEELDEFMLIHFPDENKRKKIRHIMLQINYTENRIKEYGPRKRKNASHKN